MVLPNTGQYRKPTPREELKRNLIHYFATNIKFDDLTAYGRNEATEEIIEVIREVVNID